MCRHLPDTQAKIQMQSSCFQQRAPPVHWMHTFCLCRYTWMTYDEVFVCLQKSNWEFEEMHVSSQCKFCLCCFFVLLQIAGLLICTLLQMMILRHVSKKEAGQLSFLLLPCRWSFQTSQRDWALRPPKQALHCKSRARKQASMIRHWISQSKHV